MPSARRLARRWPRSRRRTASTRTGHRPPFLRTVQPPRAIDYSSNHWAALTRYFDDGDLPLMTIESLSREPHPADRTWALELAVRRVVAGRSESRGDHEPSALGAAQRAGQTPMLTCATCSSVCRRSLPAGIRNCRRIAGDLTKAQPAPNRLSSNFALATPCLITTNTWSAWI